MAPSRRDALKLIAGAGTILPACASERRIVSRGEAILDVAPLRAQWQTLDPFLFCVHHDDAYPVGNAVMGPAASLEGRELGRDFAGKDGWRMYHGDRVPGFPQHPHRGFETVTVVRRGLLDHSDSLGATARYGRGDVQWLTAGGGILHAEMFPLVDDTRPNPVELFQIWLNLPRADKLVDPRFSMLWAPTIPTFRAPGVEVTVVAGGIDGLVTPKPPPHSWAAVAANDVAIWTIRLAQDSRWQLPLAQRGTNRMLYFFSGRRLEIDGRIIPPASAVQLQADSAALLASGDPVEILMLQGRPIGEPVVAHGPFVMNTRDEIRQTIDDYERTQFGGWRWPTREPVHPRDQTRFAQHADGRIDRPT
jgi:redox-sensitive bicupin YhaK (pirin superfamily)